MIEDSGRGYRRVVPSPEPKRILELDAIKTLLDHDYTVIALGGGGIPIVEHEPEIYFGVGAVIDKDAASALLAIRLNAERFLISTAVEKCFLNFNTPQQSEINTMDVATVKKHLADGQFGKGSMAPKVAAAVDFVERTGNEAVITCPEKLVEAMNETAGTVIRA